MSLKRFFFTCIGLTLMLSIGMGSFLYLVSRSNVTQAHMEAARAVATTTAVSVERTLALLEATLEKWASDPEIAQALASGNPTAILVVEESMTKSFPAAMLVRLLRGRIDEMDQTRSPRMGFADLDTARQALSGNPMPSMHGLNTPDAHLAIARRVVSGDGVILASISPKLITESMTAAPPEGAQELRQAPMTLAFSGLQKLRGRPVDGEVPVSGTGWVVAYWISHAADPGWLWFLACTSLASLTMAGGGWLAYRWFDRALRHDQGSILTLVDDLVSGNPLGGYTIRIRDLQHLTQQLLRVKFAEAQYKRPPASVKPSSDTMPNPHYPEPEELDAASAGIGKPAPAKPTKPSISIPPGIFRAYDICGIVGETITPEIITLLGRAIGSEARERGERQVAVARDGRLSSADLALALTRGLRDSGCSVVDLGLTPTPVLYYATHTLETRSGVMITGSHNPANHNGLKIVLAGESLMEPDIQKLRARIEAGDFASGVASFESRSLVPEYVERIVQDTHLGRPLKVVVDCGNGATSDIVPAMLEEIGCEVLALYCKVDGTFPNHLPDPGKPENLKALIAAVVREEADLGLAFDGDGDRLGVVDSSGKIIWPDRQMMLFAADVLSREPGSDIIYDVKCTRHLAGHIVRNGGRPLMWKTGHSLIKAKMRETGAPLAGEMSGHIFFQERWFGFDDGMYACARLVEILSSDPRPTEDAFGELPDSVNTPELSVDLPEGENFKFIAALGELADFPDARVIQIDGLRVDFADGFGLVRASNTTAALVVRFEADNPEALERIQSRFRTLMLRVKPGLSLPF